MKNVYINIGGVDYDKKGYMAYCRARKKNNPQTTAKRKKASPTEVTEKMLIGEEIADLMKDLKVIDSLMAFNRNGYRQWGTIHTNIMDLKEICSPFNKFMIQARKLMSLSDEITTLAKRSSRQIPSLLEQFGWQIEDTMTALKSLVEGVKKSEVLYGLQNCEVIKANGRRLGLKVLTHRAENALAKMEKAIPSVNDMFRRLY